MTSRRYTEFEWDAGKDRSNQSKHGVSFARAQYAFADPDRVILEDVTHSTADEKRYFCLGQVAAGTDTWTYSWTLPVDGSYTLLSRAADNAGHIETPDTGLVVTVDNTPPTSTIASPTNGQLITGTTYTISGFAADNLSGVSRVDVSPDGGSSWSQAGGTTDWSYVWNMPGEDNVTHILQSRAHDQAGNLEDAGAVTVTVDNVRPTSAIGNLANGQELTGTTYVIEGTAADGSGIATIEVSTDGGGS